ncbi:zinc transporter ZIP9 [Procambarus clarkii]|uniref:zinc transporter ZIP9 n=1 Tax=Procambarus clarkii TaxID=6728 RepID=UPI001E67282C|nr:zinc transporter ZIP9-like [Procambarus clarkii]
MEPVVVLTLLSLAMLVGCYTAGSIPLVMTMSEDRMEVVTVLGAGLLVGTALTVIIPEGVNTLFSMHASPRVTPSDAHSDSTHDDHVSHMELHNLVGPPLVLGFLLMLLIDQCAGGHRKPGDPENGSGNSRGHRSLTATLGLVVHAAADGIALGAAAASSHTDVEMIVFFAIMLHKAPAAFGLVTFLLHEGVERNKIRRHLIIFALAAPIGTVATYSAIVQSGTESLSSSHSTGLAMLFSAGTFLYVSTVHVLPELTSHSHDGGGTGQFSRKQLFALICGSLLPLFLTFGHHH